MAAKRAKKNVAGLERERSEHSRRGARGGSSSSPLEREGGQKPTKTKAKKRASAKPPPPAVVKKPKKPAKANKPPAIPHVKTIVVAAPKPPPRPKPTISRAKAVALVSTFLKENVGNAALHAPRASRFRLGNVVDRNGIIHVLFCHEADDFDPAIVSLGAKCLEALVAAHPQLRAFEIEVQTIRM
jgi:hypothetical protein